MFKSFAGAALATAAAAATAATAAPTSNTTLVQSPVMRQVSASDVTAMMSELGIASQLVANEPGEPPLILSTTPGGGKFLFRFLGCDDVKGAAKCSNTVVTTAFAGTGVAFEDLNTFNGEAVVTTAVAVPSDQIIIFGRNIIVLGGHSQELFKGTIYLFLQDVANFSEKRAAAVSVGFARQKPPAPKIGASTYIPAGPFTIFGVSDFSPEVAAAISNTKDVDFLVEYKPAE
jgi:hypothetical protein